MSSPAAPPTARRRLAAISAIVLACVALYGGSLAHPLLQDDEALIPAHEALDDPLNLAAVFGSRYWGAAQDDRLYRPLTVWTLALNHAVNETLGLSGEHPVGFRAVNILLHAAASCAVLGLLVRLGLGARASFTAALLFAAHPIHSEVVFAIVNRAESLAALFGLVFLGLHRAGRPIAAAACLALALCSKESAVAFVPLAWWLDASLGIDERGAVLRRHAAYVFLVGLWLVARAVVLGETPQETQLLDNPLLAADTSARVATAAAVQLEYLRLQLLPIRLSVDYSFDQVPVVTNLFSPRPAVFAALVTAALAVGWTVRRRAPLILVGVVGYAVAFAPASNFLLPIGTIMGERLAYTPSIVVCALIGAGLAALAGRRRFLGVGLAGSILLAFGGRVLARHRAWSDSEIFVEEMVRSAPRSAKAHYSFGRLHLETGDRLDEAIEHFGRATEIAPDFARAWNDMGVCYQRTGDLEQALRCYERSLVANPAFFKAHFNLGQAVQQKGQLRRAAEAYERAIELRPDYVEPHLNLGALRARAGRMADAERLWERALELDPHNESARQNLQMLRRGDPR